MFDEDKVAPNDEPSLNFDNNNTDIAQNSDIVGLDKFLPDRKRSKKINNNTINCEKNIGISCYGVLEREIRELKTFEKE